MWKPTLIFLNGREKFICVSYIVKGLRLYVAISESLLNCLPQKKPNRPCVCGCIYAKRNYTRHLANKKPSMLAPYVDIKLMYFGFFQSSGNAHTHSASKNVLIIALIGEWKAMKGRRRRISQLTYVFEN